MKIQKLTFTLLFILSHTLNAGGFFALSTLDLAKNAHVKKSYEEAELLYKKAIQEDPSSIEALYTLAQLYYQLQKYDEALLNVQEAIQQVEGKSYFFEDTRKKNLIPLYDIEGRIFYYQGAYQEAIKSFELALKQNPYELNRKSFNEITENLGFVYDFLASAADKLESPVLPRKELPKLNSELVLLKEEIADLSFEEDNEFDTALTLDIEFPDFSEEEGAGDLRVASLPPGSKVDPQITPPQIKARTEELTVKLEQVEQTQSERKKAENEELQRQSKSPEAEEMESDASDWSPSENESKNVPERTETPDSTSKSGMDETRDDKNYFKIIPYEGREYATFFFDRFDTVKGIWRLDASEKFLLIRKPYEWDTSSEVLPIQAQGFIYQDKDPKIALPVREGYAIDPDSLRFENNNAKSFQLKRGSIGTYILYIKGTGLKGSRFSFILRKLAKPAEAEAAPTPYDLEPIVVQIPEFIRKELDFRLAKVTDTEARARAIEAFILRRAIYTDNNEQGARDITPFLNKLGTDAQNRFNQMARVLNQDEDLNFPSDLRGVGLNCDLWSDFYIAIARYYKVPVRKVTGFYNRFENDAFLNGAERHAWVSVWSEKKGHWLWLEPTPRGGLSHEQQDRLAEDEIHREVAELEWLSAMKEDQRPDEKEVPPPVEPPITPEDFDWIMYADPEGEREYTPEQKAKLKAALEDYAKKENEYRLQRKSSKSTAAERLFESMKTRNALIAEELKMISAFQAAARVFNVLSAKTKLSANEQDFIARYKKSRDQLLKYALVLLARPKHDPHVDNAMFTVEIMHALALIEPVIKFDADDPKNHYKKLLDLAEKHLKSTKVEAFLEVVASNNDFYLINGGDSLYLGAKNGFSFEKIDFDPSPYTEICAGALTPDGKHYALVVAIGETKYLIRDGVRSPLSFDEIHYLEFADEKGETLIVSGEVTTSNGYYSLNVTQVNEQVFRHVRYVLMTGLQKGKVHLGVWHDDRFDEKGSDVIISSHLLVNGKKYIDPKTNAPYSLGPVGKFAGSRRVYPIDEKRFLVIIEDSKGLYHLTENFEKELLPGNYSTLYLEMLKNPLRAKITAYNVDTKKYEYYYFENEKLVAFNPEAVKKDLHDEGPRYRFENQSNGRGRDFYFNNKPLVLENGRRVRVKDGAYALVEQWGRYFQVENYSLHEKSCDLDRYLISHFYTFDPERAMLIPVKTYDAQGNSVEFDIVDMLHVRGEKYAFLGRKGRHNYLVRNGRIDGSIPPQRANLGGYYDDSIKGSVSIHEDTDYLMWSNGGDHFPYTTWLDNVPLISHTKYRSNWIQKSPIEDTLYFGVGASRQFWLLGKDNLSARIDNLRRYLIDQDPLEFTKNSKKITEKKQIDQNELLYLIRNATYHGQGDTGSVLENLQASKEKILQNAVRIPSLPMTRKERVAAVLDVLEWRSEYDASSAESELYALAEAALKNKISEPIIKSLKDERESVEWRSSSPARRQIRYLFYQQALRISGIKDSSVDQNW
ncbi:MAG: tetratricopeptide repeat protein [Bdellovibrionota bacterium]